MKVLAIACLVGVCVATPAAQKDQPFWVYGVTTLSCGAFTRATPEGKNSYEWWLSGFVSGAGLMGSGSVGHTDNDAMSAWVSKYCAEHPLETFVKAAIDLVDELRARGPAVVQLPPIGGEVKLPPSPTR